MKFLSLVFSAIAFSAQALAEATAPAAAAATSAREGITPFLPMILIFGIFYFLIIRPQQKKQKGHTTFLAQLKRGDMVVTSAGIIGTVKAVSDKIVTLEVDEGVCIKVVRGQITENAANLKDEAKAKALENKTSLV